MSEIEALLERVRENIRVAEILIGENSPDIAATRAYYAMFYIAEALLLSKGLAFSSHSAVIAAYGKEFARHEALKPEFHRRLIDAQDVRQVGDYGLERHVQLSKAAELIQWAKEFHDAADSLLSSGANETKE